MKNTYSIHSFLVWIAMWIADLVPGVSWWTIAFLAWIYERLITSITQAPTLFVIFFKQWLSLATIRFARKAIDWNFLVAVFWWIFFSILTWSRIIKRLIEIYPTLIALFFVWLIVMSAYFLFRQEITTQKKIYRQYTLWRCLLGVFLWILITLGPIWTLPTSPIWFFIGWILWSIAMILPWISWSYILLIAGIYHPVIEQVSMFSSWLTSGNIAVFFQTIPNLFIMVLWILLWLSIMSNILKMLLTRYHKETILVLIWCMLWALPSIFPEWIAIEKYILWSAFAFLAWMLVIYPLMIVWKVTK